MIDSNKLEKVTLPITNSDRLLAERFAEEQPTPAKTAQVRKNTLAVLVVNSYFQLLGIETNLSASDSWNPITRLCGNTADLEITDIGKIECLTVESGENDCEIPWEVRESRVGYIVLELEQSLRQASILGFVPDVGTGTLSVAHLHSLDDLIEHLHYLKTSASEENIDNIVNLSQWFKGVFAPGWHRDLFDQPNLTPALNFRSIKSDREAETDSEVAAASFINLGVQLEEIQLVLLVQLKQTYSQDIDVTVQLYPTINNVYLPEGTELKILSDGAEIMKAQARTYDKWIQLKFSGEPEEKFAVAVSLNDSKIEQRFII